MDSTYFSKRLYQLRTDKGVSARNMSLLMGFSDNYINTLENGKSFPSMENFLKICEYLQISPGEFLEEENTNPPLLNELKNVLKHFDSRSLKLLLKIVQALDDNNKK